MSRVWGSTEQHPPLPLPPHPPTHTHTLPSCLRSKEGHPCQVPTSLFDCKGHRHRSTFSSSNVLNPRLTPPPPPRPRLITSSLPSCSPPLQMLRAGIVKVGLGAISLSVMLMVDLASFPTLTGLWEGDSLLAVQNWPSEDRLRFTWVRRSSLFFFSLTFSWRPLRVRSLSGVNQRVDG